MRVISSIPHGGMRRQAIQWLKELAHRVGIEHPALVSQIGSLGRVRIPARDSNSVKMRT